MRRDINWKTKREDGTSYDVRVTWFAGKFKFQFQEKGATRWDYERRPERGDLEEFLETIERYHNRHRATPLELTQAKKMLADFDRF